MKSITGLASAAAITLVTIAVLVWFFMSGTPDQDETVKQEPQLREDAGNSKASGKVPSTENAKTECPKPPPPPGTKKPWFEKKVQDEMMKSGKDECIELVRFKVTRNEPIVEAKTFRPSKRFLREVREMRLEYLSCLGAAGISSACYHGLEKDADKKKCLARSIFFGKVFTAVALSKACPKELLQTCGSVGLEEWCIALCGNRDEADACNALPAGERDVCRAVRAKKPNLCPSNEAGKECKDTIAVLLELQRRKPRGDSLWPATGVLKGRAGCNEVLEKEAAKLCTDPTMFDFSGIAEDENAEKRSQGTGANSESP